VGEREVSMARHAIDAFNRQDREGMKEITHPDAEIFGLRSALEGTSYKGREGVDRFWDEALEIWEELRMEDAQIFDRDDRILVTSRLILRGRESGAEVDQPFAWLVEVRDGLTYRLRSMLDVDAACREFEHPV
jgi:ketosteroid isomerase-like protein